MPPVGSLVFGNDGTPYLYIGEGRAPKLDFTTGEQLENPTALVVKLGKIEDYDLTDESQLHDVPQTSEESPTKAA